MSNYTLNPSADFFEEPFKWIADDGYPVEDIFTRMPFQKTITYNDVGDFPNNISEYIFGRKGENDGESWQLLGKLDNGLYFWYTASATYTGFEAAGLMKLYASTNLKYIVDYSMGRVEREELQSFIRYICVNGMFFTETRMCFWNLLDDYRMRQ